MATPALGYMTGNEEVYEQHINYIYFKPVKHGYLKKPVDWGHSSIHRFIRNGAIDYNWGIVDTFNGDRYGERT